MNKLHFLFCVSKLVLSTLGFLFMDFNPQLISSTLFSCTDLPTNTLARELAKKLFIPLCVLVTLILLMCFAPVKKYVPLTAFESFSNDIIKSCNQYIIIILFTLTDGGLVPLSHLQLLISTPCTVTAREISR